MNNVLLLACWSALPFAASAAEAREGQSAPPRVRKIALGGEGGWDYLAVDSAARRLYVPRGNRVAVVDLVRELPIGELPDTPGVHGVALAAGKGYTSNGGDGTVTVFDAKTLKATAKIAARGVPDWILYDPASKRVFTFNHRTNDATAIDTGRDAVVGTVDFQAEPEAAVADGKGRIYVNLRSASEIAEFDAATLKILHRWPLAPGVRPNGLGYDARHRRLFSSCGNQKMVVMDADTGAILAAAEIGKGTDGCVFDPAKGLAYSSNGDGTITAVGETSPGKFAAAWSIATQPGARTVAWDSQTHRLYLPFAVAAPAAGGKGGRRAMVPGSFGIVVVGD